MSNLTGMGKSEPDVPTEAERKILERDWNQCEKWKEALMTKSEFSVYFPRDCD